MKIPVKSLVMGKEVTYQCYEWQKYLIYKGKKHSNPLHHAKVSLIPQRVDISLRPEIINNREVLYVDGLCFPTF